MKGNKFTIFALFSLLLIAVLALSACSQPTDIPDTDEYEANDISQTETTAEISDNISSPTINLDALRENTFIGGGEEIDIGTGSAGGEGMEWYRSVFGFLPSGIDARFSDIVGDRALDQWAALPRDRRVPMLIAFIEYFNITMEDMIRAQEVAFGRTVDEIEALISWARYGEDTGLTDPVLERFWERLVFSLSDFEALFSGDVHQLWDAFPGYGVVYNGRAYTPEWILNNIETAVVEEQIPLHEIERIINRAERFSELDDVVANAKAFLDALETGGGTSNTEARQ